MEGKLIGELTITEFRNLFSEVKNVNTERYVYGIEGICELFNCSRSTANRIKKSGKIDRAMKQIGHKIMIDKELALKLINV